MKIIIVSGPTSAGKDTVIDEILKESERLFPNKVKKGEYFKTRQMRPEEKDTGYFLSPQEFEENSRRGGISSTFSMQVDNYRVGYGVREFEKSEVVVVNIDDSLGRTLKELTIQKGGKCLSIFLYAPEETRRSRFMSREGWLFPEPANARMENDATDPNPENHKDFDLVVENREGQFAETMKDIMPKVREFIEAK